MPETIPCTVVRTMRFCRVKSPYWHVSSDLPRGSIRTRCEVLLLMYKPVNGSAKIFTNPGQESGILDCCA